MNPKRRASLAQKSIREPNQNPGAVAAVGLAAAGPAMAHVFQHLQRL